jgi:ATP-binding cassette subfamily C (CFTR/MRP) protein 1
VLGHQGLLATKARVVVTHSIAHIKHFDSVLYLRRGVILDSGPVDDVLAREESELSKLIRGHGNDLHVSGRSTPRSTVFSQSDDEIGTAIDSANSDSPTSSPTSTSLPSGRRESFSKAKLISSLPLTQPAEMTKEHREKGEKLTYTIDDSTAANILHVRPRQVAGVYDLRSCFVWRRFLLLWFVVFSHQLTQS